MTTIGIDVVPTPTGEVPVTIAPGTQPSAVIRLSGRGLPYLGRGR